MKFLKKFVRGKQMAKVARKKFQLKARPQVTFANRVTKAFEDMGLALGSENFFVVSCVNANKDDKDFQKVITCHNLPVVPEYPKMHKISLNIAEELVEKLFRR